MRQNKTKIHHPLDTLTGLAGVVRLWLRLQRLLRLLCAPITKLIIIKQGATPRQRFDSRQSAVVSAPSARSDAAKYDYNLLHLHSTKSQSIPQKRERGWDAKESPVLWLYKSGIWYLVAGIINLTREMPGKLAHKSDGLKSIGWKGKRPNDGPGGMVQSNQNQYKEKGKGNYTSLLAHAHILFCSLTRSLSHSISFFCSLCDQLIYQSQWKTRPSGIKRQWRSIHKLLINCQLTIVLGSQSLLPPEAAAVALDISWCCCILWSAGKGKTFDFY